MRSTDIKIRRKFSFRLTILLVLILTGINNGYAQNDNVSFQFDGLRFLDFPHLESRYEGDYKLHNKYFPTQTITIEAWVKPTRVAQHGGIVSNGSYSTYESIDWGGISGYMLNYHNGKLKWAIGLPNSGGRHANDAHFVEADLPINEWAHVMGTYDGNMLYLYINGKQVASKAAPGKIIYANTTDSRVHVKKFANVYSNTFKIGSFSYIDGEGDNHSQNCFIGYIDNVRVWNEALRPKSKESERKKQIIGNEENLLIACSGRKSSTDGWDLSWNNQTSQWKWYTNNTRILNPNNIFEWLTAVPIIASDAIELTSVSCEGTTEQVPEVETSSEQCEAITLRWSASDMNGPESDWSRLPEKAKRWYIERYPLSDSRNPAICEAPEASINPLALGGATDKFVLSWATTEITDTNPQAVQTVDSNKYVYYVYAYNTMAGTYSKPFRVKGEVYYPPNPINIKTKAYSSKLEVTWDTPDWWKDEAVLQTNIPELKFVLNATSPRLISVGNTSDSELVDDKTSFAENKGGTIKYELFTQYDGCDQASDKVHLTTFNYRVPLDITSAPTGIATETHPINGKPSQFLAWDQTSQLEDITEFQIFQGDDHVGTVDVSAGKTHYLYDLNLSTDCGEFDYRVYAKGMWNRIGSAVLKVVVAPTIDMTPIKASKGAYEDRVNLEWSEVSNAAGYRIYRNEEQLTTLYDKKRTAYADRDILPGEIYTYRVEAFLKCETAAPSSQSDEGFTLANGTISGLVKSSNGQSIKDVEVRVSPIINGSFFTDASNGTARVDNLELSLNSNWSLEGWVKTSRSSGSLFALVGANKVLTLYRSGNNIIFRETSGSTTNDIVSAADPTDEGEWLHIACTYANRQMKLYTNGELKQSKILAGNNGMLSHLLINTSVWYGIGNSYYDELRVWSKQLSDSDVKKNYRRTLSGNEDGLKLYLRFDEGSMETSITNKTYNLAQATIDEDISVSFFSGASLVDFGSDQLFTSGYTDDKGIYRIKNINYGGSLGKSFSVIPSKGNDIFEPVEQSITLDPNRTIVDQVDFEDQSLRPVSGYVSYRKLERKDNDPPLPNYYSGNPEVCYVENAEILVDGESTLPSTYTNSDGYYKMDVTQGSHHFSVKPTQNIIQIPPAKDFLHLTNNNSTYISVHDDGLYEKSSFTWEMWFKLDKNLIDDNRFLLKGPKAIAEIENYSGKPRLRVFLGDAKNDLLGNKILQTDRWYHLAISYDVDSKEAIWYLNGASEGKRTIAEMSVLSSPMPTSFGMKLGGSIAEVRYWNVARNEREIYANKNNLLDESYDGLSGYWDFEEPGSKVLHNVMSSVIGTGNIHGNYEWRSEIMDINVPLSEGELQPTRTEFQYYEITETPLPAYVPAIVADTAYQMVITEPRTNLNFENITGYTLSGYITGRCGFEVGKSTVRIQSLEGCFEFSQDTVGSYFEFENLPPLKYKVDVIPTEHPSIQFDPQIVDLVENKEIQYTYQAPLQIEIIREGLGESVACNAGLEQDQWVYVMKQSQSEGDRQYPVNIRVYEEYFGEKCYVEDATIHVVDNIGDGSKSADLRYTSSPSKVYSADEYPVATYMTEPGLPNISDGGDHPYQKSLTVTVTDNAGRQSQDEVWVYVEGREQLDKTFTTAIEDLPLYVLRDPPGDASYSYISRGESICRSYDLNLETALGINKEFGFDAGPDTYVGLGKLVVIKVDAEIEIGLDVVVGGGINNNLEVCVTFNESISTSDDPLLVGEAADLFMGLGLNYIFGEVRVLEFDYDNCQPKSPERAISGKIDNVSTFYAYTRQHVDSKVIPNLEKLISVDSALLRNMAKDDPKRAKIESEIIKLKQGRINWKTRLLDSQYKDESYQDDINKFYVELNADRDFWGLEDVDGVVAKYLKSALKTVNEVLDINSFEGQSERFKEERKNISFGFGSNYEFSLETDYNQSHAALYSLSVEAEEDISIGVSIDGIGPQTDFTLSQSTSVEYSKTNERGENTVTGFFLSDKDPGDFFTVDVSKDYETGIFQFNTLAGESMCPHEPNTQQREKIALSTYELNMINLDPDKVGQKTFYVSNVSETGDGSNWSMRLLPQTNPKGAKIKVNGVDISQPVLLDNISAETSIPLLIEIETNPQYYTYEDIKIAFYSNCEFERWDGNMNMSEGAEQYISINAVFGSPCVNDFQFLRVKDNNKISDNSRWVINTRDERMVTDPLTGKLEPQVIMPIVFSTFDWAGDLANSGVDYFILEYTEAGSENWIPVRETKQNRFDLVKENQAFSTMNWDVTDLPDGEYKFRLAGLCTDGSRTTSYALSGDIARTPPGVFATYPEDGQLSKGDRLGIRFDRQINCNIKPFNWKIVGVYNGVRYQPKSLRFDGVNDYLVISEEDTLLQSFLENDSDMTIEFWMKSGAKRRSTIISNRVMNNGAPGYGISVELDNSGLLEFNMVDSLRLHQLKLTTSKVLADGEWHYVAIRVDRNNENTSLRQAQIYVDMRLDSKTGINSKSWSSLQTGNPFLVGKHQLGTDPTYDGYIDEIRFWSIARDISNNTTKNGLLQTWRSHVLGTIGMAAYLKLDRGEGEELYDLMNADNIGQIVNGATWSTDVPKWDYKNLSYPEFVDATVTCNGDELLLYLPEDVNTLKALENVMLTASTIAVKDLYGNRSNLAEWQFMVNKNSISWEYPDLNGSTQIGESISLKAKLFNHGVEEENFQIRNLPDWLSVSPVEGTILPGGFVEVTFTTTDWMSLGEYSTELFAENNEGWEPLVVNVRSLCEAPEYSLDPSKYESSMNLSVPILVDKRISVDSEDQVFAFIDGELRGKGSVQFLDGEDTYRALMTVYGDVTDQGKNLVFNIWDASECREYSGIKQAFTYTEDTVIVVHVTDDELIEIEGYGDDDALSSGGGNSTESAITKVLHMNPAGDMTRHFELKKGWNWISTNFKSSGQLINAVNGNLTIDDKIVQGSLSANFNDTEWVGTMTGLNPLRAFRIYAQNEATITVKGEMVSARSSIELNKGWNWISYIPEFPLPINDAMEPLKLIAKNDDVIKSQDEFAYFIEGTGWVGNLKTMRPGTGYQIRLSNSTTFSYQANAVPTVDLGADKEVYLPENAIILSSIASDADQDQITYQWTKVSGGNADLVDATSANLNIRGLNEGEYKFALKVSDTNGASAQDTVLVNVIANQAPEVKVVDDLFVALPRDVFEITADVSDSDGKVVSIVWEKTEGPEVTLTDKNTRTVKLTNLTKGKYTFKVYVTDDRNAITEAITHLEVVEISEGNIAVNKRINLTNAVFGKATDEQAILDGDINTSGKIYGNSSEMKLEVDLFSDHQITRMLIDWNTRLYATDFTVYVAQDNASGNKNYVKYSEVSDGGGQTDDVIKITRARYVMVKVNATNARDSIGINEIKLFGVPLANSNSPSLSYDTAGVGSSTSIGSNGAENLYDDDIYSYFETSDSPFNIDVDFGKIMESNRMWVELASTSEQGQFYIYTSLDSTNWVKIWGDKATGEGFINPLLSKKVEINRRAFGRYFRLVGEAEGVALGNFKVADFKVFGVEADPRNMALNKTVIAGAKDAQHGAFALVDGYYNDGWISDKAGLQDIVIDFGEPKDIERLVMNWAELNYATEFEVSVGHVLNGQYETIYTSGSMTEAFQDITLDGLGRYMKICLKSTFVNAIPQMKEMEVYGGSATRNIPPVIDVENIITYATQDTLTVTGFDPLGNITNYYWTQVSGNTNAALTNELSDKLIISNLEPGIYSFKVEVADDSSESVTAYAKITVLSYPENLALNRSSDVKSGAWSNIAYAFDGEPSTIAQPSTGFSVIGVNLDEYSTIERVRIIWENGTAKKDFILYSFKSSWEGNVFEEVLRSGSVTDSITDYILTPDQVLKSRGTLRLQLNASAAGGIQEFEVYGRKEFPPALTLAKYDTVRLAVSTSRTITPVIVDDLPAKSYLWEKLSGDNGVGFQPNAKNLTLTNLKPGNYSFKFTVQNIGYKSATDTVMIYATDNKPIVNAGADLSVDGKPNSVTVDATAQTELGDLSYEWTQVSGSTCTLSNTDQEDLVISDFSEYGDYIFRLTVENEEGVTQFDEVKVTVFQLMTDDFFNGKQFPYYQNFEKLTDGDTSTQISYQGFYQYTNSYGTYTDPKPIDFYLPVRQKINHIDIWIGDHNLFYEKLEVTVRNNLKDEELLSWSEFGFNVSENGLIRINVGNKVADFVRVSLSRTSTERNIEIKEVEIYGLPYSETEDVIEITRQSQVAISASTTKDGYDVTNLIDGDYNTEWRPEPNQGDGEITIDLGAEYYIESVEVDYQNKDLKGEVKYSKTENGYYTYWPTTNYTWGYYPVDNMSNRNRRYLNSDSYRYVKLTRLQDYENEVIIDEIKIYGKPVNSNARKAAVYQESQVATPPVDSWIFDPAIYEKSEHFVIEVAGISDPEDYFIGSFEEDIARGFVKSINYVDKQLFFLNALGESDENIRYEFYNASEDGLYHIQEEFTFESGGRKGTIEDPVVVHIGQRVGAEPVFNPIADQIIYEGEAFETIDISEYFEEYDYMDVSLDVYNITDFMVEAEGMNLKVIPKDEHWFGRDSILVTANFTGKETYELSRYIVYRVENVDDTPELEMIPTIRMEVGDHFELNLDQYLIEWDGDPVKYEVANSKFFDISVEGNVLEIEPKDPLKNSTEVVRVLVFDDTPGALYSYQDVNIEYSTQKILSAGSPEKGFGSFPNPFDQQTEIKFYVPDQSRASLKIYGTDGRLVRVLANDHLSIGHYSYIWDGRDSGGNTVSTGLYISILKIDDRQFKLKILKE